MNVVAYLVNTPHVPLTKSKFAVYAASRYRYTISENELILVTALLKIYFPFSNPHPRHTQQQSEQPTTQQSAAVYVVG